MEPEPKADHVARTMQQASTINVSGVGRATAQPDVVRVRLTATALRPTLVQALADSEDVARRLREALSTMGVPPQDATTLSLAVHAEQVWTDQEGSRITGFRSDHELSVTLRELPSAGRVLGEALLAGGDDVRLHGVVFAVEDDGALRTAAREAAWHDALARAGQLASLAGRPLGQVITISEGTPPGVGPVPRAVAMAAMGSAQEIDVQPGSVNVEVGLSVQWAIV
jgi:uncharacterized protein YggE